MNGDQLLQQVLLQLQQVQKQLDKQQSVIDFQHQIDKQVKSLFGRISKIEGTLDLILKKMDINKNPPIVIQQTCIANMLDRQTKEQYEVKFEQGTQLGLVSVNKETGWCETASEQYPNCIIKVPIAYIDFSNVEDGKLPISGVIHDNNEEQEIFQQSPSQQSAQVQQYPQNVVQTAQYDTPPIEPVKLRQNEPNQIVSQQQQPQIYVQQAQNQQSLNLIQTGNNAQQQPNQQSNNIFNQINSQQVPQQQIQQKQQDFIQNYYQVLQQNPAEQPPQRNQSANIFQQSPLLQGNQQSYLNQLFQDNQNYQQIQPKIQQQQPQQQQQIQPKQVTQTANLQLSNTHHKNVFDSVDFENSQAPMAKFSFYKMNPNGRSEERLFFIQNGLLQWHMPTSPANISHLELSNIKSNYVDSKCLVIGTFENQYLKLTGDLKQLEQFSELINQAKQQK